MLTEITLTVRRIRDLLAGPVAVIGIAAGAALWTIWILSLPGCCTPGIPMPWCPQAPTATRTPPPTPTPVPPTPTATPTWSAPTYAPTWTPAPISTRTPRPATWTPTPIGPTPACAAAECAVGYVEVDVSGLPAAPAADKEVIFCLNSSGSENWVDVRHRQHNGGSFQAKGGLDPTGPCTGEWSYWDALPASDGIWRISWDGQAGIVACEAPDGQVEEFSIHGAGAPDVRLAFSELRAGGNCGGMSGSSPASVRIVGGECYDYGCPGLRCALTPTPYASPTPTPTVDASGALGALAGAVDLWIEAPADYRGQPEPVVIACLSSPSLKSGVWLRVRDCGTGPPCGPFLQVKGFGCEGSDGWADSGYGSVPLVTGWHRCQWEPGRFLVTTPQGRTIEVALPYRLVVGGAQADPPWAAARPGTDSGLCVERSGWRVWRAAREGACQ